MSFGCTKEEMERRRQACIDEINADLYPDEIKKKITKCSECPFFDACCADGEEHWNEAVEKARLPNGKFGKLYKECLTENE